jgi:hypothetical protein
LTGFVSFFVPPSRITAREREGRNQILQEATTKPETLSERIMDHRVNDGL